MDKTREPPCDDSRVSYLPDEILQLRQTRLGPSTFIALGLLHLHTPIVVKLTSIPTLSHNLNIRSMNQIAASRYHTSSSKEHRTA